MSDALSAISWWIVIQVLGLAAWPLAFRWLRWLPDRGYMLAKPLGLLLVTYGLWLLATLGVIDNSIGGALVVLLLVVALSAWVYRRGASDVASLRSWLREHRSIVVAYEVLLVLAFVGWAIFRAHNPDLSTTEKPMEFAFFNAIGRSTHFPPQDPWLAGYGIAYYYFGYVMLSVLHQLSGVTAGAAFSLSNALWFALSAAGAFGLVVDLILLSSRRAKMAAISFGVLGAIMLVLMGNFEASLEVARVDQLASPQFFTSLDILDLNQPYTPPPPGQPNWPPRSPWWWWRASRVIHDYPPSAVSPQLSPIVGQPPVDGTTYQELIDEFPQFSFLLGDMHPHVLALPYALLAMALALNLYQAASRGEVTSLWSGRERAPYWLLYAWVVGGLSFLNTWDFPIYAFVLVAALALGRYRAAIFNFWDSLLDLIVLAAAGFVFYIPFYRGFTSQAAGIAPNLFNGTRFGQFFVMFGPFIVIGLIFGGALIARSIRDKQMGIAGLVIKSLVGAVGLSLAMALTMTGLTVLVLRVSQRARDWFDGVVAQMNGNGINLSDHVRARLSDPWTPLLLALAMVAIFLLWRARRRSMTRRRAGNDVESAAASPLDFVLLLYSIGLLLTFGVEFAFIIDTFGTRMNTVFKFYYQAWALWSVASAFAVYWLTAGTARTEAPDSPGAVSKLRLAGRAAVGVVTTFVVALGLMYPALAIPDKVENAPPTLDAVQATARYVPDEYAAAKWLNDNVTGTPIILEATGEEYNAGTSRISTWTGLPTLVGWPYHEYQWRGNYDVQSARTPVITEIYSTTDTLQAQSLLNQYSVDFVHVGPNERRLYTPESLAKFDQMLPLAFEQGDVRIYRVLRPN